MRCHNCGTESAPAHTTCPACGAASSTPMLSPGMPTYGVRGLGLAAALAVGATTALYLVTALYPAVGAVLAERAAASRDVDLLRGVVLAEGLLGLPFTLVYLVAAALVMIWLFRARKNTDAFPGVHPQVNAHWAISGWWVPFANLVMPCKVMAGVTRDTFSRTRTPALVGVWWAAWLVYGVADMFAGFAGEAYDPAVGAGGRFQDVVDHYRAALLPNLLPAVACLVAGVALIMLIQRVSAAQQDRIDRAASAWPIATGWPYPPIQPVPADPMQSVTGTPPQVATDPTVASPQVHPGTGGTIRA